MHLLMILTSLGLAWLLRSNWSRPTGNWTQRWQKTLFFFILPPWLVLMTVVAILSMGPQGKMVGLHTGWFSYYLVMGCAALVILVYLKLANEAKQSLKNIRTYTQINLNGKAARLLNQPILFIAQIGFWQPELVISQGLLLKLKPEHLEAVLAHEQAHYHYRDTFWFFWLGWLRRLTTWLPNTEQLWQELLLLRELRADSWAAKRVDSLLLAESLLTVVSTPQGNSDSFCAAFSRPVLRNRLQERIDALLDEPDVPNSPNLWAWSWLLLGLIPLLALPFHS